MKFHYAIAAAMVSLLASPLSAAVLSYDESVDGDIDFFDTFSLDIGTNTISGSSFVSFEDATNTFLFDGDSFFELVVPTGAQVDSITYAFSNVNVQPGSNGFGVGMHTPSYIGDWEIDIQYDSSPVSILNEILPLGPSTYNFDYYVYVVQGAGPVSGGDWDYTLTFEVNELSAVPVPAAVWLFGSGLLGLVGMARRKKTV